MKEIIGIIGVVQIFASLLVATAIGYKEISVMIGLCFLAVLIVGVIICVYSSVKLEELEEERRKRNEKRM